MKKVFLAFMAVATIALVGCKKNGGDEPTPTPTPTPVDPVVEVPELDGTAGAITIAAYIPDGICKEVFLEGAYQGWDLATGTKFEPIEGYANWYQAVIAVADPEGVTEYMGHCKMYLNDEEGNVPGDWSSQWNSSKVVIAEESASMAALVDDQGQQAMEFYPDAIGAVIYLTVGGWQSKPCVNYGVAAALKIKCANITVYDESEDKDLNWQWVDMIAEGNGVFSYVVTIDLANGDNFGFNTGYEYEGEIVEARNAYEGEPFVDGDKVKYTFTSTNGPKGVATFEKLAE